MTVTGDIVRADTEAWLAGDLGRVLDLYHPDLVLHYGGSNPLTGEHRGKDAAIEALLAVQVRTERVPLHVIDMMENADHAAAWVRERWVVDGEEIELDRLFVYRTADGMLAECWLYDRDQALVDRVLSATYRGERSRPPAPVRDRAACTPAAPDRVRVRFPHRGPRARHR